MHVIVSASLFPGSHPRPILNTGWEDERQYVRLAEAFIVLTRLLGIASACLCLCQHLRALAIALTKALTLNLSYIYPLHVSQSSLVEEGRNVDEKKPTMALEKIGIYL